MASCAVILRSKAVRFTSCQRPGLMRPAARTLTSPRVTVSVVLLAAMELMLTEVRKSVKT